MRDLDDVMEARMAICPATKIDIPKCLIWSRQLVDISNTEDTERWHQLTSKGALEKAGAQRQEQEVLWAERTADSLRCPDASMRR